MVKPEEDGHLHQDRQAAGERIETHFLLQFLGFLHHFLLVVFVFIADLLHLGLDFLHFPHGAHLVDCGANQEDAHGEGEQHNG